MTCRNNLYLLIFALCFCNVSSEDSQDATTIHPQDSQNDGQCSSPGYKFDEISKTCVMNADNIAVDKDHGDPMMRRVVELCNLSGCNTSDAWECRMLRRDSRALYARRDIQKNTTIISIAKDMLITSNLARETPIAYILQDANIQDKFSSYSYIYMPIFILEDREDDESAFQPYYSLLPTSFRNVPIFWTKEELNLLNGSYLKERVLDHLKDLENDYKLICKVAPEFSRFSFEQYKWAHTVVLTRVFRLFIDGKETNALVPIADMINHNTMRQTFWNYDEKTEKFTVVALEDIEKGSEIYISYGKKSNNALLLVYGFTIEENSGLDGLSYNTIPLDFTIDSKDPQKHRKRHLITRTQLRFATDYNHIATREAFAHLRVIAMEDESLPSELRLYELPLSCENEIRVLEILQRKCQDALAKYPTSLEDDIAKLNDKVHYPLHSNKRNALIEIKSEKEILSYYNHLAEIAIPLLNLEWFDLNKIRHEFDQYIELSEYVKAVIAPLLWKKFAAQPRPSPSPLQDYQDRMQQFMLWANETGGISGKLAVSSHKENGRGVVALEDIVDGEVFVRIPKEKLITADLGRDSPVGYLLREMNIMQNLTGYLGVYFTIFILQDREDSTSPFHPYYNILPQTPLNLPTFWSKGDLDLLNGSHVKQQVIQRNENIQKDYQAICEAIPEFRRYTLEEYKWAYEIAMSRNFKVKIGDKGVNALVPFADMLNHNFKEHGDWSFDMERNTFSITAVREIYRHNQIYASYGNKCNSRFLISYGFSIENRTREEKLWNEVHVTFHLEESDPLYRQKLSFIKANHRSIRLSMDINRDSTREAFSFLRLLASKTEEEIDQIREFHQEPLDFISAPIKPLSCINELNSLELLMRICNDALSEYPTSIQDDLNRLEDKKKYALYSNRRNALVQVIGEKEILHHYLQLAQEASPLMDMSWKDLKRIIKRDYRTKTEVSQYVKTVVGTLVYKRSMSRSMT